MSYFKNIVRYALPYKVPGILSVVCNVFFALFSTLSFLALMPVLQILFIAEKRIVEKPVWDSTLPFIDSIGQMKDFAVDYFNYSLSARLAEDELSALIFVCAIVLVLFFLKNLFGYFSVFFLTFLQNGVLRDLRNDIYAKMLELPISYFSEKRKGDMISRITADVNEVQTSFLSVLVVIVREPLTIIFTLTAMLLISVKLTIFVLVFLPISGFIISYIGKSLKKRSHLAQAENGYFLSIVEETLSSLKIIKGFNGEEKFNKIFRASTNRLKNILNKLNHRQNLAGPSSEFLGIFVIVIILWYGGNMVLIEKTLAPVTFIGFMGLTYIILTPIKQISKASYSIKKGNASAERILSVLQTRSTIIDLPNAIAKKEFVSEMEIHQVSFQYEKEKVLKNFSMKVKKGQTVALVGQSGSGKSTIANLVTRFYDVNEGEIKIDGTNIKEITKKSLRNLMGLVTQDSILFNDTIKNNISLGKENATDEEIIEALKIANAWEFVKELPQKLETNIGDSGNKLSGGQKQRLSIARAVLKNPPIMILDEATSALDTESERLVQKALENMMKNRTSIVIAHRLSTIQNADNIIVMQRGEIVEQGKHDELLATNGTYKKLVEMQSFD